MNTIRIVSYTSAQDMGAPYVNIDVSEIIIDKSFICKALSHASTKDTKMRQLRPRLQSKPRRPIPLTSLRSTLFSINSLQ